MNPVRRLLGRLFGVKVWTVRDARGHAIVWTRMPTKRESIAVAERRTGRSWKSLAQSGFTCEAARVPAFLR